MTLREMQRMIADLDAEVTRLKRSLDVQPVRTGRVQGGEGGPVTTQHYTIDDNFGDYVTAFKGHNATGDLDASKTYYIAKPWILRALPSRDGKTYTAYVHGTTQTRTAARSGAANQTETMIPRYVIGDMVRAVKVSKTGVSRPAIAPEENPLPLTLEDTNESGRYWGEKHVG